MKFFSLLLAIVAVAILAAPAAAQCNGSQCVTGFGVHQLGLPVWQTVPVQQYAPQQQFNANDLAAVLQALGHANQAKAVGHHANRVNRAQALGQNRHRRPAAALGRNTAAAVLQALGDSLRARRRHH